MSFISIISCSNVLLYLVCKHCVFRFQTKEGGKALLKTIAAKRGEQETEVMSMDETGNNLSNMNETNISTMDMIFSPP